MYEVSSQTITDDYKAENAAPLEWKFQISNGNTGELILSDELLDSEALATQRAKSEFLKNAYKLNEIRFSTHKTSVVKNMVINGYGLPYIVKGISTVVNETSIKASVRAVRYE